MISQRLMRPGSFSVELIEGYPQSIATAVDVFDHIVITPTRLQPIGAFSDANILANAIYTGPIVTKSSPRTFEGHDLSYWLGTPDGLGDIIEAPLNKAPGTLSQWFTDLRPASLSAGTVTNTFDHTGTYQWMSRREALDAVCKAAQAEWRVNPSGTLDGGSIANLFVTSPTVVITRKEEGQDGIYRGLDGTLIVVGEDVEQYATKVIVCGPGEGERMLTDSRTESVPAGYKDLLNGALVMERLVNAPDVDAVTIGDLAAAMLAQFNVVRRKISQQTRTYAVTRFVKPGDYVYIFDQLAELVDPANQITYRGELITPLKQRVFGITWPLESGVGVYARRSAATPVYTDLTDHIAWESGEVVWEVGAPTIEEIRI